MNTTFEERDDFGRKAIAENLIKLLDSEIGISPTVLDGPWGSGKTEFCLKLNDLMSKTKPDLKVVYIDSFRFDHSDEPLLMLISGIAGVIPEGEKRNNYLKKAVPVLKVLGKVTAKTALNWLVKTNIETINEEFSEAVSGEGEGLLDKGIESVLEDYGKIEKNLKTFKTLLGEISSESNILIIIDELDRCNPKFALATLEKVKHVFDVKGVKFLFSTNLTQLASIVKKQYGADIDAEGYLNKFFKFSINLPQNVSTYYESTPNALMHFKSMAAANPALRKNLGGDNIATRLLRVLFERNKNSLRDIEKFYNNILIYNHINHKAKIQDNTIHGYALVWTFSIYLYTFFPEVVRSATEKTIDIDLIERVLGVDREMLNSASEIREIPLKVFSYFLTANDDFVRFVKIDQQNLKVRQGEINSLFQGAFDAPSIDSRLGLVLNVFKTLQLSCS
jgi:hypothetical protein